MISFNFIDGPKNSHRLILVNQQISIFRALSTEFWNSFMWINIGQRPKRLRNLFQKHRFSIKITVLEIVCKVTD